MHYLHLQTDPNDLPSRILNKGIILYNVPAESLDENGKVDLVDHDVIRNVPMTMTEEQKEISRANIGVPSIEDLDNKITKPSTTGQPGQALLLNQDGTTSWGQAGIADAPSDNDFYVRRNNTWSKVTINAENVSIHVSSTDGLLDVEGIEIVVSFTDGTESQSLFTDANGNCSIMVTLGKTYTITLPDQPGYNPIASYTLNATGSVRQIDFQYSKPGDSTCELTIRFTTSTGGNPGPDLATKSVNLIFSDGMTASKVLDSSGYATFTLPRGKSGYVQSPRLQGCLTPATREFITDFSALTVVVTYETQYSPGVYMVKDNGDEVLPENWVSTDSCIAFHIATIALLEAEADFYIRPSDLTSSGNVSRQWATSNVAFPHVSYDTSLYNGQANTQAMLTDAADLGITSPAAEYVSSQSLTVRGNLRYGYLPSYAEFTVLLNNRTMIDNMVRSAGLTPNWYGRSEWVSSQYSAADAWRWPGSAWNTYTKSTSDVCLPVFAI